MNALLLILLSVFAFGLGVFSTLVLFAAKLTVSAKRGKAVFATYSKAKDRWVITGNLLSIAANVAERLRTSDPKGPCKTVHYKQ